jgi:crotonobetainyl-CoA hydratase
MTDEILYEKRGNVALVTLHRPDAMNAVNQQLARALGEALENASADSEVRAIVLTGSGRAFCAGMDLKAFSSGESAFVDAHPEWGFAGITRHAISVPTIAAVNGIAVGGGAEMVLACDLAVAGDSVRFGFPEVTRGLVAAAGGVLRLQRQVPRKIALELVMTGELINAARAAELGLINRVVPDSSLLDEALALASRIAANAPLAVQTSKRFIQESDRFGSDWDDEIWEAHDRLVLPLFDSQDAAEGARAFVEKRPPVWTGR